MSARRPRRFLTPVLLSLAVSAPLACRAESGFQSGSGSPLITMAHVDFQITVPKFIFLRIGTGTGSASGGWGSNASIDLIRWTPAAATVGNGVALAGSGGDLTGGVETAVVVANHGNVTLSSTTSGKLSDGAGDTVSYATIKTAARKLTTVQVLAAPALADGATRTITVAATAKIVQRDAKGAYTYSNATVPPAGTYGGINTNNGRVTYTASVP
jgi:hypothetical protein